jgi:hypothetical protein
VSSAVVELALNTITIPKATRHRAAVRRRLYSIGWVPERAPARSPIRLSDRALTG